MVDVSTLSNVLNGIKKAETESLLLKKHKELPKLINEELRHSFFGGKAPPEIEKRLNELEGMKVPDYDIFSVTDLLNKMETSTHLKEVYNNCLFSSSSSANYSVLLILPSTSVIKYIVGTTSSGKRVVAALPLEYHADIVEAVEDLLKEKLSSIKGGKIKVEGDIENPQLKVFGESQKYGEADHKEVVGILTSAGIKARVSG
ncbi:MAG: hypothetical protein QW035_00910 [Candidatus Anstonellales archaeon]